MADELTDSQIELLCEIEEHDQTTLTGDKGCEWSGFSPAVMSSR